MFKNLIDRKYLLGIGLLAVGFLGGNSQLVSTGLTVVLSSVETPANGTVAQITVEDAKGKPAENVNVIVAPVADSKPKE